MPTEELADRGAMANSTGFVVGQFVAQGASCGYGRRLGDPTCQKGCCHLALVMHIFASGIDEPVEAERALGDLCWIARHRQSRV